MVADVDAFPGHIACAASTRSEIVVPVHRRRRALIGVLDVDSDTPAAFDAADAAALEALMAEVFGGRAAAEWASRKYRLKPPGRRPKLAP